MWAFWHHIGAHIAEISVENSLNTLGDGQGVKPGDETLRSRHILGALSLVRSSATWLWKRCYDWENAGDVNICIIYTYTYTAIYRERERVRWLTRSLTIYAYIYMCVCVSVCAWIWSSILLYYAVSYHVIRFIWTYVILIVTVYQSHCNCYIKAYEDMFDVKYSMMFLYIGKLPI